LRPRNLAYTSPTRQLYSGLSTDFIRDSVHNRIAEKVIEDAKLLDQGNGEDFSSRSSSCSGC